MSDLVVIDASALLFAIDKGDVTPVLTQLCCQEVAAKLVRKVRGLVITAVKARAFFDLLSDVSFMHVVDVRDFESLFSDAMTLGCGSYDAAYLRAALDNGAQLATLDKKLMPHLRSNKVQRWEP